MKNISVAIVAKVMTKVFPCIFVHSHILDRIMASNMYGCKDVKNMNV